MKTKVSLPKSNTPFLMPDGSLSREWYQFFTDLWNRVGGSAGQSDTITDADGTLADATRAINETLDALELYKVLVDD